MPDLAFLRSFLADFERDRDEGTHLFLVAGGDDPAIVYGETRRTFRSIVADLLQVLEQRDYQIETLQGRLDAAAEHLVEEQAHRATLQRQLAAFGEAA